MTDQIYNRAQDLFQEKLEEHPGKFHNKHQLGKLQEQCLEQAEQEYVTHCEQLKDALEDR